MLVRSGGAGTVEGVGWQWREGGTSRYRAGFIVRTGASTTAHHTHKSRWSLPCDLQRLQARGAQPRARKYAHTLTHTNTNTRTQMHTGRRAHTHAARVRPLLSARTRHLKAHGRNAHVHTRVPEALGCAVVGGFDSLTLQWEGAARSRVFSRHSFTHHL